MTELSTLPVSDIAKSCDKIDLFAKRLAEYAPAPHQPVFQRIAGGIYMRTIKMQPGLYCISKKHKSCNHFIVSRGRFEMWSEATGDVVIDAREHPVLGVTVPGTIRAFHILEETYFTLYFRTDCTDLSQIEAEMIEPYDFPEQKAAS